MQPRGQPRGLVAPLPSKPKRLPPRRSLDLQQGGLITDAQGDGGDGALTCLAHHVRHPALTRNRARAMTSREVHQARSSQFW